MFTENQLNFINQLSPTALKLFGFVLLYQDGTGEIVFQKFDFFRALALPVDEKNGQTTISQVSNAVNELKQLFGSHFTVRVGDNDLSGNQDIITVFQ